ncbi:MAG: hypothetical protein RSC80_11035 [Odoribacter sp.]
MKQWFQDIYKNPFIPSSVIAIVALLWYIYDTSALSIFITLIGFSLSLLMAGIAIQQYQLQKNNLKLQLFDKRYKVFESLARTKVLLVRNDISDRLFFEYTSFPRLISEIFAIQDELSNSAILSQSIFYAPIPEKMFELSIFFDTVVITYIDLIKKQGELFKEHPKVVLSLLSKYDEFLCADRAHRLLIETELETVCPKLYDNIRVFSSKSEEYIEYIKKIGIFTDFDKYLKIQYLDK